MGYRIRKYSSLSLFFILALFFPFQVSVQGQDIQDENRIVMVEELNLKVNGSLSPILVNVTIDIHWVSRLIWSLEFVSNQLLFTNFAGGSALTNGIDVMIDNGTILGDGEIKTNHEFSHTSYDIVILSDEAGTKNRILICRWSFFKMIPPYGIRYRDNQSLQFKIQDDLTAAGLAITDFTATVEGWKSETIVLETSDLSDWWAINLINWWALVLFQNIWPIGFTFVALIVVIKLLKG